MRRKQVEFLHDRGEMPSLWVEGIAADRKPLLDTYGDVGTMLDQAIAAARLGLGFRLDFYRGEIGGGAEQEEAHLTVWREVRSDCVINPPVRDAP